MNVQSNIPAIAPQRTCGNTEVPAPKRSCGNTEVPPSVTKQEDTFTIRDRDGNANLNVAVKPGVYFDPPTLSVSNGDTEVASFSLDHMGPHEAGVLAQKDLTGQEGVDTISVQELDNAGYKVEFGEATAGQIHKGFMIRDSQFLSR